MKEKNTEKLKLKDLNICPIILNADADVDADEDTDAGGIAIALMYWRAGALTLICLLSILSASPMSNYFPERPSGAPLHILSK